jgi:DNA mismatch repair protein MutS2
LKLYAHSTAGITNASMEFDLETLRPTYRLTLGLPGRSNALAIAGRLGLSNKIIDEARTQISPEELRAEDLLNEIHRQRDLARKARDQAERAKSEADKIHIELARRYESIEDERRSILEKARLQAEDTSADLQREIEDVRKALNRARQPVEALRPIHEKIERINETAHQVTPRAQTGQRAANEKQPLRLGEKVRVRSIKMEGVITALGENDVEVQVGNLRVRARLSDLQRKGEEELPAQLLDLPVTARTKPAQKKAARGALAASALSAAPVSIAAPSAGLVSSGTTTFVSAGSRSDTPYYPSPGMEIDLRGQRVEDGLEALDRYLESAYLAGLLYVRIIHGKGTGRLRSYIREALGDSAHVKRWENATDKEGGEGVTIAHLKVD